MYPFLRTLPLLLGLLLTACGGGANRQEIDLSDQVTDQPADGIGHYVYALSLPKTISPGETLEVLMDWRTVGPADGRKRYAMEVLLDGPDRKVYYVDENQSTVGEINLVNWLNYYFPVPEDFTAGEYTVGVRLLDVGNGDAVVPLGFSEELGMGDGFYRVAALTVGG